MTPPVRDRASHRSTGSALALQRDDEQVDGEIDWYPVGPDQTAKNRLSGPRRWTLGALTAQLFLTPIYSAILTSGLPAVQVAGATALLLAFSVIYVVVVGRSVSSTIGRRTAVIAALLLLTLPLFFTIGTNAPTLWIFVGVAGGMLLPDWAAMALGLGLAAAMLVIDVVAGVPPSWELALALVALTAFMVGFAQNVRLNSELRRTREQLAAAAVAAERERIGRDLHDILGHSLTAIAVKAGLARKLVGRDNSAAAAEIGDVERLAREALTDVRATTSGFREVSLASELAVARTILQAAGISPVLPRAVDEVDPSVRELFGYVVREAVTNVVRHSNARTCTVTLGGGSVQIVDDGSPADRSAADNPVSGSGLSGLADRIAAAGGTFRAGPRPGGGFVVRASLPTRTAARDDQRIGAPGAAGQPRRRAPW